MFGTCLSAYACIYKLLYNINYFWILLLGNDLLFHVTWNDCKESKRMQLYKVNYKGNRHYIYILWLFNNIFCNLDFMLFSYLLMIYYFKELDNDFIHGTEKKLLSGVRYCIFKRSTNACCIFISDKSSQGLLIVWAFLKKTLLKLLFLSYSFTNVVKI